MKRRRAGGGGGRSKTCSLPIYDLAPGYRIYRLPIAQSAITQFDRARRVALRTL